MDKGASAVWQSLGQLANTGSVLYVVAHPDDEDGALLTEISRCEGARAMLFSVTRGEGGANKISSDFFDALGILRTLEHIAAARYYGSEVYYSLAVDYGYSKQLAEAMRSWGGVQPVLADLVRVIRRERPDVLAARFRGDPRDGHGHHQFAGVIARSAFDAAADPNQFPEQIAEGLRPWQAAKLYHDNLQPDERDADAAERLAVVDTGQLHPIISQSYAQIARRGLSLQRSQGMGGSGPGRRQSAAYYRLVNSTQTDAKRVESSLLEGIDTSIVGLAARIGVQDVCIVVHGLAQIQEQVDEAVRSFSREQPVRCAPALLRGLTQTRALLDELDEAQLLESAESQLRFHLTRLIAEFQTGAVAALKIELAATCEATSRDDMNYCSPGDTLRVVVRVQHHGDLETSIEQVGLSPTTSRWAEDAWDIRALQTRVGELPSDKALATTFAVRIPTTAEVTRPYWKRDSIDQARYDLVDARFASLPLPPPPLTAQATLLVDGIRVQVHRSVEVRASQAGNSPVTYPLHIIPAMSVGLLPRHRVVPISNSGFPIKVFLRNNHAHTIEGEVYLESTANLQFEPERVPFRLSQSAGTSEVQFLARVNGTTAAANQAATIRAVARAGHRVYEESVRMITAPDLSRFPYYQPATVKVNWADLEIPDKLAVGYVRGTGDEVGEVLQSLGVNVEYLDTERLASGELGRFDAMVVGVRAYAVRDDLIKHNDRLLDYVREGGVAVIQYQTPEYDENFGPYPYVMGRRPEEVSEQDALVQMLVPDHPVMRYPHRIGPADFDGWIEQRGSKFLTQWDDRYLPLLACMDNGQPQQRGGLLYARSGKGAYIYAAYAWYRQLPQGVAGAHRLFANLISHRRFLQEQED